MLAIDAILQNRYRIIRQLGQGGMGTVYEARALRLNATVALKETHFTEERLRKQFEREAQLLAGLRHPALPRVIDHFDDGDGLFLVMDFVSGSDLFERLEARGQSFPPEQVVGWMDQLLDALDYLHAQDPPIIHRDIKPQNLKLSDEGKIILLDFGLAKGSSAQQTHVTTSGSIFGYTPNYAPLEQIRGTGTDARSDLYSLAATAYHLMTGVVPPDVLMRLSATTEGQPDPLRPAHEVNSLVAPALASVLTQAMGVGRHRRFESAAAMRTAMRGACAQVDSRNERAMETTLPVTISTAPSEPDEPSAQLPSTLLTPARTVPSPTITAPSRSPAPPTISAESAPIPSGPAFLQPTPKSNATRWIIAGVLFFVLIVGGTIVNLAYRIVSSRMQAQREMFSVEGQLKQAQAAKERIRSGDTSPDNIGTAEEAIQLYERVLSTDANNDEAFKSIAEIYGATGQPDKQYEWMLKRANNVYLTPENRAQAFSLLADREWKCSFEITEQPENKYTVASLGRVTIQYRKPKDPADFDRAKMCAARGLEQAEKAIMLSPEYDLAWAYKAHLLRERAKLASMDGDTASYESYLKQANDADNRYRELAQKNPNKSQPPELPAIPEKAEKQ